MEQTPLRAALKNELKRRQDRNPAYSLRAFAKNLGVSPAQISQIISGKRTITMKTYKRIAEILHFSPLESAQFLEEVSQSTGLTKKQDLQVSEDQFRLISDWWNIGILTLARIKHAKKDAKWISEELGITIWEAESSLARLERMELIESGEELKRSDTVIRIQSEHSSLAIQKAHQQTLHLASEKLHSVPMERRDYTSMTMAINPENLPKATKLIREFQNKLLELLEKGEPSEVFTFSCQLFPLTESSSTKQKEA